MFDQDITEITLLDKVIRLQDGLVSQATGGGFDGGDDTYKRLRTEVLQRIELRELLPDFVRRNRDLNQFWQFIKFHLPSYAERRNYLWDQFRPMIEYLEANDRSPGLQPIESVIAAFNAEAVHSAWQKALDRRVSDPEGAITAARTLLESACKHILDEAQAPYPDDADLPKLWHLCAQQLNLAPHQHQEELFKSVLGNCQSIVNNIGAIRNKIGDAHGTGRRPVKATSRHAELVVNLAGTMTAFLIATWKERNEQPS